MKCLPFLAGLLVAAPATAQDRPDANGAGQAARASQALQVVNFEFPTYDADRSGSLNQSEFGVWVKALLYSELKATGKSATAAEISHSAASAFATADKDRSQDISRQEMVAFLVG